MKNKKEKNNDIESKYKPMTFTIDPVQVKKLKKWQL